MAPTIRPPAVAGRFYPRDPDQLRRNALIALGNSAGGADADIERVLRSALRCARPLVRAHAVWTAARLGRIAATSPTMHPRAASRP